MPDTIDLSFFKNYEVLEKIDEDEYKRRKEQGDDSVILVEDKDYYYFYRKIPKESQSVALLYNIYLLLDKIARIAKFFFILAIIFIIIGFVSFILGIAPIINFISSIANYTTNSNRVIY